MNIRNFKLIFICLLLIVLESLGKDSIEGKISQMVTGEENGLFFISIKLRNSDRRFLWEVDTTNNFQTFNQSMDSLDNIWYKEGRIKIIFDEQNKIIDFEYLKQKRIRGGQTRRALPVLRWKKPTNISNAYNAGDSAIKGGRYFSLIDSNMWSPQEAPNYWDTGKKSNKTRRWKKPSGAHDCFNKGHRALYMGGVYESLIDGNVWSPDEYRRGWKYIHIGPAELIDSSKLVDHSMPEPETRTTAPTYSQPSGAHDAYQRGDVVSLNGTTYRSIIDANVWSPEVAQSYWEVLSSDTRSTVREWKKPTGIHDCYHKGYKMHFNGKTYESLMNSNVWSPDELPSSWIEIK